MATCSRCGVETELYECGVPICPKCSGERESKAKRKLPGSGQSIRKLLLDEIAEANARLNKARQTFFEVMSKTSGFPHPDGTQHIHNVSRELSNARQDLIRAHAALNDFLKTG